MRYTFYKLYNNCENMVFMKKWRSLVSTNVKCICWGAQSLQVAPLCILQRFKLFWIGKNLTLCEMYNVFLGFENFYRKFIKDYLKIMSPLTQLTQKNQPFVQCRKANSAFEGLK